MERERTNMGVCFLTGYFMISTALDFSLYWSYLLRGCLNNCSMDSSSLKVHGKNDSEASLFNWPKFCLKFMSWCWQGSHRFGDERLIEWVCGRALSHVWYTCQMRVMCLHEDRGKYMKLVTRKNEVRERRACSGLSWCLDNAWDGLNPTLGKAEKDFIYLSILCKSKSLSHVQLLQQLFATL